MIIKTVSSISVYAAKLFKFLAFSVQKILSCSIVIGNVDKRRWAASMQMALRIGSFPKSLILRVTE